MDVRYITNWIRAGLLALPVSGLLTAWATLEAQPDQTTDPRAWARFVSSTSYQVSHLVGSTGGTILAIFGVFALGAFLATSRSGRLALAAMVVTVAGHALLLVPAVISTFATPAIGRAYLAGIPGVMRIEFPAAMTTSFMLGLLLAFVGNLLLGVAMWRSRALPRWAGVIWIAATVMFYILGVVLGQATTGSSLPTQPVGAVLFAIAGARTAWTSLRSRPARAPVPTVGEGRQALQDGRAAPTLHIMTSRVVHFEIPIDDSERAGAFYRSVFGWDVTKWGPVDYWTMTTGAEPGPGAEGALTPRTESPEGVVVYVGVDNIDDALARVTAAGGTLLTEKMPIPTMGWSAHFRDSEGNLIGLFQADATVPMPEGGGMGG